MYHGAMGLGRALLATLLLLAACGGDDVPADASVDAADSAPDAAITGAAPPDIPWWNALTDAVDSPFRQMSCREGYRTVVDDGITLCEPWPETGRATCGFGDNHFPGTVACAAVGAPCPSGEMPEDLPLDATIRYVDDDAAAGGDGSLATPFQRISEALVGAEPGTVVAVAKGTYDEALTIPGGITVQGACAAESIIAPSFGDASAAVEMLETSRLTNIGIHPRGWGIHANGESVTIEGVHVEGGARYGILHTAGRMQLDRVVVQNVARSSAGVGTGILSMGVQAILSSVVVDHAATRGVELSGVQGVIDALTIVDTSTPESGGEGVGIVIGLGSVTMGTNLLVERSVGTGLQIGHTGTMVQLTNAIVRDTTQLFGDREGQGIFVDDEAVATLSRVRLERNFVSGIDIGRGASVQASGFLVQDIVGGSALGEGGHGVGVANDASASLSGGVIRDVQGGGVVANGDGTELTLRGVWIHDISPDPAGAFGRGVGVQLGATATIETTLIQSTYEIGIFVGGADTSATLRDVVVQDTQSQMAEGFGGRGLSVENAASVTAERLQIDRSHELALIVMDGESAMSGTDVAVSGVAPRACASTTCPDEPFGIGLGSYYGARLDLTSFEVADSELCGLQLAEGASIDLTRGLVTGATIGACVQVDGYDLDRLSNDVEYRENGSPLESTMLPIPDPN